jgi:TRAP-type C4-dicarboxylate transport system permease small subunit
MNKWAELLLGLILVIVAIWVAWYSPFWWGEFWDFRSAAWEFLKGGVFWFIVMIGFLFILLGISEIKG